MLSMNGFLERKTAVSSITFTRMMSAVFLQGQYNAVLDVPENTMMVGKTVLITGGSAGIGFETAKALCERGAKVIIANRTVSKLVEASKELEPFCKHGSTVSWLAIDLGDLNSVVSFVPQLLEKFSSSLKIDVLIENAGVWPREHSLSPQGYEASFATNLLGHYLLRMKLHNAGILAPSARIVVVTGDIYIKATDCTPNFEYTGEGEMAYCRSKLGVHWMFNEFVRRYPQYEAVIIHPGVIRTQLAVDHNAWFGLAYWIKSIFLLSEQEGAQTQLICATAPSEKLVKGGYYHNTCGLMELPADDTVNDTAKSTILINTVDTILAPYLAEK